MSGVQANNLSEVLEINENAPGSKKLTSRRPYGKQILREMMARHIPSHIMQAAKQGFHRLMPVGLNESINR